MDPSTERRIDARGTTYTLKYGNRALRLAEMELNKPFNRVNWDSIHEATAVFWAGLQSHHPDLRLEDVDEIIDEVGMGTVAAVAAEALEAAMPRANGAEGNGNRAQRRAAARSPKHGNGIDS